VYLCVCVCVCVFADVWVKVEDRMDMFLNSEHENLFCKVKLRYNRVFPPPDN